MNYSVYMGETDYLTSRSAEKLSENARTFIDAADARKAGLPEEQRMLFGNQLWNCDLLKRNPLPSFRISLPRLAEPVSFRDGGMLFCGPSTRAVTDLIRWVCSAGHFVRIIMQPIHT